MKRLKTLKSFQIQYSRSKFKKSKTYSGLCPYYQNLSINSWYPSHADPIWPGRYALPLIRD
jgi:hypothetical protein